MEMDCKRLKSGIEKVVQNRSAVIFAYYVSDPKRYGVINFDDNGEAISIEKAISPQK